MNPQIIERLKKDKIYNYLKENSYLIKLLYRNDRNYDVVKNIIKEKYHLRFSDKVSQVISDIELFNSVISSMN